MSTDLPATFEVDTAQASGRSQPLEGVWFETALTALFTAATVLFVSFIAVISGLV